MRVCEVCREPLPEDMRADAVYCNKARCKSRAYRKRKKDEDEERRKSDGRPPVAGAASETQTVHLQPGEQTITLVCGCGAHTKIHISHSPGRVRAEQAAEPDAQRDGLQVASPIATAAADTPLPQVAPAQVALPSASVAEPVAKSLATALEPPAQVVATQPEPSGKAHSVSATSARTAQAPSFKVHELFGMSRDAPTLLSVAVDANGRLRPGYKLMLGDTVGEGFNLCDPASPWRFLYERLHAFGQAQAPGHLIVYAQPVGVRGDVQPALLPTAALVKLFGERWADVLLTGD